MMFPVPPPYQALPYRFALLATRTDDDDDNNTNDIDIDEAWEEMEEVQEKADANPPAAQLVDQTGGTAEEAATGSCDATTVNDKIFEDLRLSSDVALEVQQAWKAFMGAAENREDAAETICQALFHPRSQIVGHLLKKATQFMDGLSFIIDSLSDPTCLKDVVKKLGFQHVDLLLTVPHVKIVRDAIVGLLVAKMGPRLSQEARVGFATVLNYVGGSYIFIRKEFELNLLLERFLWQVASNPLRDINLSGHEGALLLIEQDGYELD